MNEGKQGKGSNRNNEKLRRLTMSPSIIYPID